MKTNHTPGPWKHDLPSSARLEGNKVSACDLASETKDYIATIYGRTAVVCIANAKLIAAAPDLMQAAILVLRYFPDGVMNDAQIIALSSLNKAVKKAQP